MPKHPPNISKFNEKIDLFHVVLEKKSREFKIKLLVSHDIPRSSHYHVVYIPHFVHIYFNSELLFSHIAQKSIK